MAKIPVGITIKYINDEGSLEQENRIFPSTVKKLKVIVVYEYS